MSMDTRFSGSARVDSTSVLPSGEVRGLTKNIKITEDVRKYAAEQGMSYEQPLHSGMEEKARDFIVSGSEVYSKA
jgi:hypothetical protein